MKINRIYIFSFIVILTVLAAGYISLAFFVGSRATVDSRTQADVILVLGARSYIDNKYNPCLEARVQHATRLYKTRLAPKLLVTGGDDIEDNVNEAETMKKIAVENGVDAKDILLEKAATSTYENFTLSQPILKKNSLESVIVVTEPFHIARASLIAKKLGYKFTVSPAKKSPCWQPNHYFSKYFLKEPFAIMTYKLQNKL